MVILQSCTQNITIQKYWIIASKSYILRFTINRIRQFLKCARDFLDTLYMLQNSS